MNPRLLASCLLGLCGCELMTGGRGPVVTGVVVDSEGRPIAGARVLAVQFNGTGAIRRAVYAGQSAADGTFDVTYSTRMQTLPRQVTLTASAEGYAPTELTQPISVPADLVKLVLRRGARVHVRVLDEAGAPMSAPITIERLGAGLPWPDERSRLKSTDADGRYTITAVPEGEFLVRAARRGSRSVPADQGDGCGAQIADQFEVSVAFAGFSVPPAATEASVELRFIEDVEVLTGRVVDEAGLAVAGASVIATQGGARVATTDDTGAFVLTRLNQDAYAIDVWAKGFHNSNHWTQPRHRAGESGVRLTLTRESGH